MLSPSGRSRGGPSRAWQGTDTLLVLGVTLLAGLIRFLRLDSVPATFDEPVYLAEACRYLKEAGACEALMGPEVHPPLAKLLMAAGMAVFGNDVIGARVSAAAAGTFCIPLLFVTVRTLSGSRVASTAAAFLLSLDFLHLVMSRLALIDIFALAFGLASLLALTRDHVRDRSTSQRFRRPFMGVAGALAGAAVASKWSGLSFVALTIVLTVAWGWKERAASGPRAVDRLVLEEGPPIVCYLFVLPALIYLLAYVPGTTRVPSLVQAGSDWPVAVAREQRAMAEWHSGYSVMTPYRSSPAEWWSLRSPLPLHVDAAGGREVRIKAMGNPLVWWGGAVAVAVLLVRLVLGRARKLALVAVAGIALTYVPYLAFGGFRSTFFYYFLPTVPFVVVAVGEVTSEAWRTRWGRFAVGVVAAAVVGLFAFFYPVLAGVPLNDQQLAARAWFDDCEIDGLLVSPADGPTRWRHLGSGPDGWCWGDYRFGDDGPTLFESTEAQS